MRPEYSYADKSPIHGKGLFAKKQIRKGTRIGTYEGPRAKRDDTYVLWVQNDNGRWVGIDGKNDLRYLNHSSKPNAEFEADELYAIRTIRKDEEITFDYGEEWADVE